MRSEAIAAAIASIAPPCVEARGQAQRRQDSLTKPQGALGRLEEIAVWMAGVTGEALPAPRRKVMVVAAGDHGVAARGVSAYPADVTAQMVANFLAGGAAINVMAAQAGADVRVVSAGVRSLAPDGRLHVAGARAGTTDFLTGPAMSRAEAEALVAGSIGFAAALARDGYTMIGLGDMGIGNTTAAAAVTSMMTDAAPELTVGRGTGIDDGTLALKRGVVEAALRLHADAKGDALAVLACVGGFEIAFLGGVIIGAAAARLPVVLDGYPTTAAALVAAGMAPATRDFMLASHQSVERGHAIALAHLGLPPLLDLQMRLGEGTGAALAMMIVDAALRIPREMATFASAGVSSRSGSAT